MVGPLFRSDGVQAPPPLLPSGVSVKADEAELIRKYQAEYEHTSQIHPVDEKRVSLMLLDAYIEGTHWEGGSAADTFRYWNQLLRDIKEGKDFINPNVTPQEIEGYTLPLYS